MIVCIFCKSKRDFLTKGILFCSRQIYRTFGSNTSKIYSCLFICFFCNLVVPAFGRTHFDIRCICNVFWQSNLYGFENFSCIKFNWICFIYSNCKKLVGYNWFCKMFCNWIIVNICNWNILKISLTFVSICPDSILIFFSLSTSRDFFFGKYKTWFCKRFCKCNTDWTVAAYTKRIITWSWFAWNRYTFCTFRNNPYSNRIIRNFYFCYWRVYFFKNNAISYRSLSFVCGNCLPFYKTISRIFRKTYFEIITFFCFVISGWNCRTCTLFRLNKHRYFFCIIIGNGVFDFLFNFAASKEIFTGG